MTKEKWDETRVCVCLYLYKYESPYSVDCCYHGEGDGDWGPM